jgi:hypothetical protein
MQELIGERQSLMAGKMCWRGLFLTTDMGDSVMEKMQSDWAHDGGIENQKC